MLIEILSLMIAAAAAALAVDAGWKKGKGKREESVWKTRILTTLMHMM